MSKEKKAEVGSLTFKKFHIYSGNFLKPAPLLQVINIPLHGQQARSRNRIAKIIGDRAEEIEKERMALIEKFGKKDKDGKIELDSNNNYQLADQVGFQKEFEVMMDENTTFDVLPSNKADWLQVKQIVLDCKIDFDINGTEVYEQLCQILEKI